MCDVFDQKDYVGVVNVSYMAASSLPHIKVRLARLEMLPPPYIQAHQPPLASSLPHIKVRLARLEMLPPALWALTSRHTNPLSLAV